MARSTPAAVLPETANIRASVDAAATALEHLAASLRRGGFAEGVHAYERMAEILVGQRLWLEAAVPPDAATGEQLAGLRRDFDDVCRLAQEVFGMLAPYAVAMQRLAALGPPPTEQLRARVLATLDERGRRGSTMTTLRRALGADGDELHAVLVELVEDNHLVTRGAGSRTTYIRASAGARARSGS